MTYGLAERDYEKWRKSTMSARYKHETRFLYGRKAPIPPNCDAIEALLRLELLDWLTRKATMLGCTSSHEILRMALKEIFPNEDATRFDLVEELYSLPQKPPMTMHTLCSESHRSPMLFHASVTLMSFWYQLVHLCIGKLILCCLSGTFV